MEERKYQDIRYSSKNPIESFITGRFISILEQSFRSIETKSILEVGCGEGFVLQLMKRILNPDILVGSDISTYWLERAYRLQENMSLLLFDAREIPFPDNSFDLVVAVEVLEHIENPEIALDEIARVTSDWAVISVPNAYIWRMANIARGKYWSRFGNTPGHVNDWTKRSFRKFLSNHFVVQNIKTIFPWIITVLKKRQH